MSSIFFFSRKVGYKVRLEGIRGRDTRLLFCTTGVLLRRLLVDRSLKGVTHVFVDEIHERGMNEGNIKILRYCLYGLIFEDCNERTKLYLYILMKATQKYQDSRD